MLENSWHKKEKPLFGLTGLGGGVGSNLVGGGGGGIADEYFAKKKYPGTGSAQHITTDLDMTGGGLTWIKADDPPNGRYHTWCYDDSKVFFPAEYDPMQHNTNITSWTSTGFNLGSDGQTNANSANYHSWNFKEAEGFLDTVTFTGNSPNTNSFSHSLGQVPGLVVVKDLSSADARSNYVQFETFEGGTEYAHFNRNWITDGNTIWNDTSANSNTVYIGTEGDINGSGRSYKAWLFAKETDGLIKCGNYTGAGSSPVTVTTGFRPQFLLIKSYSTSMPQTGGNDWVIIDDSMATVGANQYKEYFEFGNSGWGHNTRVNSDLLELSSNEYVEFTGTGFKVSSSHTNLNESGYEIFYMAIAAP